MLNCLVKTRIFYDTRCIHDDTAVFCMTPMEYLEFQSESRRGSVMIFNQVGLFTSSGIVQIRMRLAD